MDQKNILILLKRLLGNYKKHKGEEYSFVCPQCNHPEYKKKLQINLKTQKYQCWVCNIKGRSLYSLFKNLNVDKSHFDELKDILDDYDYSYSFDKDDQEEDTPILPKEFISLTQTSKDPDYINALHYVKSRGLTKADIIRYNLGYCSYGMYSGMVIIPSYDEKGQLNYFVGRSFYEGGFKYKNPEYSKNVIGFGSFVNWNFPIIIVEGVFDAMAVKRNAIPLLGKSVPNTLIDRIMLENPEEVYIALDGDALDSAIEVCETFYFNDITVKYIEMGEEDPSSLGFDKMWKLIDTATPLDFRSLVEMKIG